MSELTHDAADDGFHEIQLSGKQLVFLFMMTTVVSVVIFLCGVLVGRNARSEAIALDTSVAAAAPTAGVQEAPPSAPPANPPAPVSEGPLTYHDRLSAANPPSEKLKPQSEEARAKEPAPPVEDVAAAKPVETRQPPPPPARSAAPAASTPNARTGTWAVQVVSLRDRAAATRIVQRLDAKGYPAFLVPPAPGAPAPVYRVQVGRFSDRQEAERVSDRLKKEEQFDPWIIR